MSNEATQWAKAADLPSVDKHLLLELADLADGTTFAVDRLDLAALASRCGMAIRTVRMHMRVLEQRGYVVEEERRDTHGRRMPNRHHLNVRGLAPVSLDGVSPAWKQESA